MALLHLHLPWQYIDPFQTGTGKLSQFQVLRTQESTTPQPRPPTKITTTTTTTTTTATGIVSHFHNPHVPTHPHPPPPQVQTHHAWNLFELVPFALLGMLGGTRGGRTGALGGRSEGV